MLLKKGLTKIDEDLIVGRLVNAVILLSEANACAANESATATKEATGLYDSGENFGEDVAKQNPGISGENSGETVTLGKEIPGISGENSRETGPVLSRVVGAVIAHTEVLTVPERVIEVLEERDPQFPLRNSHGTSIKNTFR